MVEIIDRLTYLSVKNNKPELLKKLGKLVGGDENMLLDDCEAANKIISDKIEDYMKQGTIVGDLKKYSNIFSNDMIKIEFSDTARIMVRKIMEYKDVIEENIERMHDM